MELPGFDIDYDLNRRLLALQDAAAPIVASGPRHPSKKNPYFRALADAYEAGLLVSVKEAI